MSAERLREAADRLDALAAKATSGPWSSGLVGVYQPEGSYVARWEDATRTPVTADRMYIAAMHPGVGKALAAWLRLEADIITARGDEHAVDISGDHALGVADAILGGAS